jgi:hypothetical protein
LWFLPSELSKYPFNKHNCVDYILWKVDTSIMRFFSIWENLVNVHFFFVVVVLGLELRASWTICPGWLQTAILLISDSTVARITGMSHQHPAKPAHF